VSPVRYELVFYVAQDDILHSHRHKNLKSYERKQVWETRLDLALSRLSAREGGSVGVWGVGGLRETRLSN
jgi:hypothetical protein